MICLYEGKTDIFENLYYVRFSSVNITEPVWFGKLGIYYLPGSDAQTTTA